ncbi:glycosyltransferase [Cetobacterium somerae]
MEKPFISVAMLAYNHERFIEKAIDSILNQKHNFNIEIIIGEDFSKDNTRKKLKKYEQFTNIKIIKRNKNIGVVKNILEVFKECKGKYIALLEGDDYWEDEYKLHKMINYLEENTYIGAFSEVNYIDEYGNLNYLENIKIRKYKDVEQTEDILNEVFIPTCTLVFENIWRENFSEIYKEWIKGAKYICDLQLKFLLTENGKLKYFPEKMSAYRYITNGESSYSSQNIDLKIKDELKAYQNIYLKAKQNKIKIKEKINYLFLKAFFIEIKKLNLSSTIKLFKDNKDFLDLKKIVIIVIKKIKKGKI